MSDLRIFVSHSHADNEFCLRLVRDLRGALDDKDAVWMDVSGGLKGGDPWWSKIKKELAERPIFIVIHSPDASNSKWVEREIAMAWSQMNSDEGKLIIPIIHRECQLPSDLATLQAVSFVQPRQYRKALQELKYAIGIPKRSRPRQRPERSPSVAASHVEEIPPVSTNPEEVVSYDDAQEIQTHGEEIGLLDRVMQMGMDNQDVWINIGEGLRKAERLPQALLAIGFAIASNPQDVDAWTLRGEILNDIGRQEEALAAFTHVTILDPENAYAWFMKGWTHGAFSEHEEALAAYERGLEIDPEADFIVVEKAEMLMALRRYTEAYDAAKRASELDPGLEDAWQIRRDALECLESEARKRALGN